MAKDLSQAARNTSNKAQKTSKDRFDKADILLAKKEVSVAAKNTIKKKKADIVQDFVVPCQFKLLESEDNLIDSIKLRFAIQGMTLNKSEILRTAIKALERQTDKQLKTTFSAVEKIKASEDHSAVLDLKSVEHYSATQQVSIDKSNDEHISNIKAAHEKQLLLQQSHITELRAYIESYKQQIDKQGLSQESHITELRTDIDYYKQQIDKQQQIIDNLHHSYDTVMTCLLEEKRKDQNIRELSADAEFEIDKNNERLGSLATSPQSTLMSIDDIEVKQQATDIEITDSPYPNEQLIPEHEQLFAQALIMRQEEESEKAFFLFEQAAKLGYSKAMGAMGRSYFLGEGIEKDQLHGLAWLINAAEQNLPPAVTRVKYFQENDADLYQEALILSEELYQSE